jgi:Xaa-Pro aminopeptidase
MQNSDTSSAKSGPAGTPFLSRRERFLAQIGNGVAILVASPELLKSRDTDVRYRANSDLLYLTDFAEPETVAVFTPHDPEHRLTLFVRPRDAEKETWTGRRHGVEGARERFGADAAYPLAELDERLPKLLEPADAVWYSLGSSQEMDRRVTSLLARFRLSRPRSGKGPWDVRDPAQVLDPMRLVKEPAELELMRESGRLAAQGHLAAMRMARPGVGEWELEAAVDGTYRRAGAWGPSYPTIVGSAVNGTILHYTSNDRVVEDGDLVLIDAGAELGNYCSDITRTFPVNGRFTPAQRALYDVVAAAEEAGIAAVAPGNTFQGVHDAAVRVMVKGLADLGLLPGGDVDALIEDGGYKRFNTHQTSHWLGLDVHDAGGYREPDGSPLRLRPGMVLTVEPGLYIPDAEGIPADFRGLGIRVEDDVIVTETGREVITRDVPVDADEIEAIVGSGVLEAAGR